MSPNSPMVPLPRRDRRRQLRASDVDKLKKRREPGQKNRPGTFRNERTPHQLRELIFHRLCPQIRNYTQKKTISRHLEVNWRSPGAFIRIPAVSGQPPPLSLSPGGHTSRESHILHVSASLSHHVFPVGVIETERKSRLLHCKVPMTGISRLDRHHLPPEVPRSTSRETTAWTENPTLK